MDKFVIASDLNNTMEGISTVPSNREVITNVLTLNFSEPVTVVGLVSAMKNNQIDVVSDTIVLAPYSVEPSFSSDKGLEVTFDGEGAYTKTDVTLNSVYTQTITGTDGTASFQQTRSGQQNNMEVKCINQDDSVAYYGATSLLCLLEPPMICSDEEEGSAVRITWSYPRTNPDVIETVNVYFFTEAMQFISKVTLPYDKDKSYVDTPEAPVTAIFAKITFGNKAMETDFSRLIKL